MGFAVAASAQIAQRDYIAPRAQTHIAACEVIHNRPTCVPQRMNWLSRSCLASRRSLSLALLLPPLLVAGCGGLHLEDYQSATPRFDPFNFFPGNTRAWGIVQDWRGRVTRTFEVVIEGSTEDDVLTLEEHFRYDDGETSARTWRITRNSNGSFNGAANDVIGIAAGATAGNAMRWRYSMDLEVHGRRYHVDFDDWMWQVDDAALINRSYIRKFGLTVAEVTLFMYRNG